MTISSASLAQIHLAVVGAGPVGATAALLLSKQGYKVTLIDRQEPQPGPTGLGMDIRNVALSRHLRSYLKTLRFGQKSALRPTTPCKFGSNGG